MVETKEKRGKYPCPVRTKLAQEHYQKLVEDASSAGMSLSKYVRHRLSGFRVRSKYDLQVLNELRRQGGLLKHLATQGVDTAGALDAIITTMRKLRNS